jgi:peptide deformylase
LDGVGCGQQNIAPDNHPAKIKWQANIDRGRIESLFDSFFSHLRANVTENSQKVSFMSQIYRVLQGTTDYPADLAILRQISAPIDDIFAPEVQAAAAAMAETLALEKGAGIAAPQIGILRRMVIISVPEKAATQDDPDNAAMPPHLLVNPVILEHSPDLVPMTEGCLSVAGLYSDMVPRHPWVIYEATLETGDRVRRRATGFHAKVVQHELDHLNGILYTDHIAPDTLKPQPGMDASTVAKCLPAQPLAPFLGPESPKP